MAVLAGILYGGLFPVLLRHLTGETEKLSIRPQNLDPFVKDDQLPRAENRLAFINYSSDGKVTEGHGRLLDQTLMLLRFHTNVHEVCVYFFYINFEFILRVAVYSLIHQGMINY